MPLASPVIPPLEINRQVGERHGHRRDGEVDRGLPSVVASTGGPSRFDASVMGTNDNQAALGVGHANHLVSDRVRTPENSCVRTTGPRGR